MSTNDQLKTELEEFEALLDEGEAHNEPQPNQKQNTAYPSININPTKTQLSDRNSNRSQVLNKNVTKRPSQFGSPSLKTFEDQKSNEIMTIGSFQEIKNDELRKDNDKKRLIGFRNICMPNIDTINEHNKGTGLGSKKDGKSSYRGKEGAFQPLSSLRDSNRDLQRTSYNELLLLFKDSTSNNPTKVFDETMPSLTEPKKKIPKRTRAGSKSSVVAIMKETDMIQVSSEITKDPILGRREEEVIRDVKKTIEELVEAIQCDPLENYVQSLKFETQKMSTNDWKEVTMILCPVKVEIIVVDLINFGIENRTEICLKSKFSQDVGSIVNKTITQISGRENEGKHVLIYLHERNGQRKLFLSKFFFIVKSNHPYPNNLKSEKDIILNYLIVLGIYQFKLQYEDKPVSEDKINTVKTKALNIVKGTDHSLSPHLTDWLNYFVRPQIFVEKFYINQNVKGKTDVNFAYNLYEFLKATSSQFYSVHSKFYNSEKKFDFKYRTNLYVTSSLNDTINSSHKEIKSAKDSGILSYDNTNTREQSLFSTTSKKKPPMNALFFDPDLTKQTSQSNIKNTLPASQFTLNSPANSFRSPKNALLYLSPRDYKQVCTTQVENKRKTKQPNFFNKVEFTNLGISKPYLAFDRVEMILGKTPNNSIFS